MVKIFLPALSLIFFLASCSTLKPLNFTSNKQESGTLTPPAPSKFIEDIVVSPEVVPTKNIHKEVTDAVSGPAVQASVVPVVKDEKTALAELMALRAPEVESASEVELKYAVLLDTEVESLPSKGLLEAVDEYYGVRYRSGGNTKTGIDCSGFTVAVFAAAYGLTIPRVSREQYRTSRKISTTELKEGDLVFFNTNGRGVSHVGIYLGNNKFIHASVSRGVMVNDLFQPYYLKRFVGAGRIDDKIAVAGN